MIEFEIMQLISIDVSIWGSHKVGGWKSSLGVGSLGSSEEEDVGFWFVKFVVDPASGLLDSDGSPFLD